MPVPSPYSPEATYITQPPAAKRKEKKKKIWVSQHQLKPFVSGKGLLMEPGTKSLSGSNTLIPVSGHQDALVELCLPCWETLTSLPELC